MIKLSGIAKPMKNEYRMNPYELSDEPSFCGHSMIQDLLVSFTDFFPIVLADKKTEKKAFHYTGHSSFEFFLINKYRKKSRASWRAAKAPMIETI